jgi:triacylglycerol esterase/lipase EstA (alpha/beta hydrolase family)
MFGPVKRALQRPETYFGHLRELAGAGMCVAMYPLGVLDSISPARFGTPRTSDDGDTTETPVLLVHGFGHNRSGWTFLTRQLHKAGFSRVYTVNYNPFARDVPRLAEDIGERVRTIADATGSDRVHVVGHSLGGLLLRYYVQLLGGDEIVDTAITIATPHGGTNAARLGGATPTASQLLPDSWVIRRLEQSAAPSDVRWIAYYSNLDLFIQPGASARIEHPALNATNILVKDHGHLSLLVSPRLTRSVAAQLAAAEGMAGFGAPVRTLSPPAVERYSLTHPVYDAMEP